MFFWLCHFFSEWHYLRLHQQKDILIGLTTGAAQGFLLSRIANHAATAAWLVSNEYAIAADDFRLDLGRRQVAVIARREPDGREILGRKPAVVKH